MTTYRSFAIRVAKKAGDLLMRNYGKSHGRTHKSRIDFKIQVDDASDHLIRNAISKAFPKHNIYSEETSNKESGSEFTWVIDPLDGTFPYAFELSDHFSVNIALVKGKTPILGVTYAPKRKELFVAEAGKGAFCNKKPINVSNLDDVNKSIMAIDFGHRNRTDNVRYMERLLSDDGIANPVSYACASLPLGFVASGKLHGYLAAHLEPWDMAPGIVLIREAGGKVTDINGKKWELGDKSILAANPKLHKKLLELIHS